MKTEELLETAARLKVEEPLLSCHEALSRAARQLGAGGEQFPPDASCDALEEAVKRYQALFRPAQPAQLRSLRAGALEAMRFLEAFQPRLVGSVLSGTADAHSSITLHLFASTPEDVMLFLMEQNIPFDESTRLHRYRDGRSAPHPVFSFVAGAHPIDLVVFSEKELREAPVGAGETGQIRRANAARVERLLDETPDLG
ncbi:MAG: hypothetical protein ACP5DC_02095 [Halothiobacillaceae bacterium]